MLTKHPLFKNLSQDEISRCLTELHATKTTFKKNENIASEGSCCTWFGIVLSGEISIEKVSEDGSVHLLTKLSEGSIFAEIVVYSADSSWPASVRASTDAQILCIDSQRFIDLAHPKLIKNFLGILSNKARKLNKKIGYLQTSSLRKKIAIYLLEFYERDHSLEFCVHHSREEMANYLSVTRPSLSRELSKMKEDALIDYHRNTFKIIDLKKLRYLENL